MPRIRTIKPEFWGDEKLAPCSPITRLVFLGLISMADDAGRIVDNPKVIDAFIFPESSETSRGSVGELVGMGRIRRGKTASGQRILEIVNWKAHQKIEKCNLKAALPEIIEETPLTDIPRQVGETSGNGRGGVGDESSNHTYDLRPTTVVPTTDDLFPPRRVRRQRAKEPRAAVTRESWVARAVEKWAPIGPLTHGRAGKALKPLVDIHGWEAVEKGLDDYLAKNEGERARLEWFVDRGTYWVNLAKQPLTDENGNETERYRAIFGGRRA